MAISKGAALYQATNGAVYELATFNRRMFAATIDVLIWCVILTPLSQIAWIISWGSGGMKNVASAIHYFMIKYGGTEDLTPLSFIKYLYSQELLYYYLGIQLCIAGIMGGITVWCWYRWGGNSR